MSEPSLGEFLSPYTPDVRELVLKARHLVMDVLPEAIELVDPPSKIVGYGYGRRYADLVCAIAPYKSYVNLIFSVGASLPDPEGLLSGTGKHARHVKIRSAEDIDHPGVRVLLEEALRTYRAAG
jgi:hypothetical protein